MKLDIPDVPPSPNRVLGKHWSTKAGEKDKWILLIRSQIVPGGTGPRPFRMRVRITLCKPRPYDQDNAYAACKPVIDALRHWGLIWDDSPKYLELVVEQKAVYRQARCTIIELEAA